jgi:nucleoside-diphosphate-sugar epimerase
MEFKIAITGASGWFGSVFISYYINQFGKNEALKNLLLFSSDGRDIRVSGVDFNTFLLKEIQYIKADYIIHAAFLTRDKISALGEYKYKKINSEITRYVELFLDKNNVKSMFLLSSGAASQVGNEKDIYSEMKLDEEALYKRKVGSINIFRIFAAISTDMPNRDWSALSNFINKARKNEDIEMHAEGQVIRSFVSFDDLSKLIIAMILKGTKGVLEIDAVSEDIEIISLARYIAKKAGVNMLLKKNFCSETIVSKYTGDSGKFIKLCHDCNLEPIKIKDQIDLILS